MSGFGRAAGGAVVEWLLFRAGSRLLSKPKAEATGLAPKQAAERHDPLASPSEGFVFQELDGSNSAGFLWSR